MAQRFVVLVALAVGLDLSAARAAHAHLVSTGFGPFYDGAAHFFVSIEQLLPVLALALLAGLRGPRAGRYAIALLPSAWLVSGLVGLRFPSTRHRWWRPRCCSSCRARSRPRTSPCPSPWYSASPRRLRRGPASRTAGRWRPPEPVRLPSPAPLPAASLSQRAGRGSPPLSLTA